MKKYILERHEYSPEQNKIYFENGVMLKTPGCRTIKEVKEKYFKKVKPGLSVFVSSIYTNPEFYFLNRINVASGRINSRIEALKYCKEKLQQPGGPLIDGSYLPANKLKFKFKYI